ncbi:hypothetical protein [Archangium violaceum]|uniref:hypothetical protein n=1 Tax=Archangium violaceum TaxID=83451 RepID=UPI0036DAA794
MRRVWCHESKASRLPVSDNHFFIHICGVSLDYQEQSPHGFPVGVVYSGNTPGHRWQNLPGKEGLDEKNAMT